MIKNFRRKFVEVGQRVFSENSSKSHIFNHGDNITSAIKNKKNF